MEEIITWDLTKTEYEKLRRLLDNAGDTLRDHNETELADGCDHWLEILESLNY